MIRAVYVCGRAGNLIEWQRAQKQPHVRSKSGEARHCSALGRGPDQLGIHVEKCYLDNPLPQYKPIPDPAIPPKGII